MTYIGSEVFRNCSKLRKITLPKDLNFISSYTFYDCTALESVNIPNSVTSIADYAFYNCSKLSGEIDIPSTVTKIGASAFYNCALITGVTVGGKTPPTLGTNAFEDTGIADIRVPCGAVDTYKNADNWSAYADIIKNDGHKADTHIAAKDATCTEAGNDEYWICGCGKYMYSDADGTTEITSVPVIPAPGHSWSNSWSGGGITHWHECTSCGDKKDEAAHSGGTATCRAKATCEICGEEYGDPEDHDYGTDWVTGDTQHWHECIVCGDKTDTADHTFEQKRDDTNHWQECPVCGYKKDETAHSWGAWSLTAKPTFTALGAAERECSCGEKQTKSDVPALSDITSWEKDDTRHVDATEDNDGRDVYTSEYGEVEVTIPKLSHKHTLTHVPEVPATETTAGVKEHWHCDGCGKDFADANGAAEITDLADLTIPVIGHTHTLTHIPGVPATETTTGTKEHWHCDGCGRDFADENGTKEVTADDLKIGKIKTEVQAPLNVPKPEIATSQEELIAAALTGEEQQRVAGGTDIRIILKVEDASESASAEDKGKVEAEISGRSDYKLGQYLDITLLKKIGEEPEQEIAETDTPIRITFAIPESFSGKAEYSVIRVHSGTATVLPDLDSAPDTVTIETDKFSTYALTHREKDTTSKPSGGGSGGRRPHSSSSAPTESDTSDNTSSENNSSGSDTTDATSDGKDTSDGDGNSFSEENSSDSDTIETISDESGTSGSDESLMSEADSSDGNTVDIAPSGGDISNGISSGNESNHAPGDSVPSEDNENPSTGIAVSLIPLTAALAAVVITAKHRRK